MRIGYIILSDYAERVHACDDSTAALTLSFTPASDGYITVAGKQYRLKHGEAKIPYSDIPSGTHSPVIDTNGSGCIAEPFIKSSSAVEIPNTEDDIIRRLLKRCRMLEESVSTLKSKTERLEKISEGHRIFG